MRYFGRSEPGSGAGIFTGHFASSTESGLVMLASATLSLRGRFGGGGSDAARALPLPAFTACTPGGSPSALTFAFPLGAAAAGFAAGSAVLCRSWQAAESSSAQPSDRMALARPAGMWDMGATVCG